jgi:hypothetical protein
MLFDPPRERNLFANLSAGRTRQDQLRHVDLCCDDLSAGCSAADVDHDDFVLGELADLGLLAVLGLDAQQATEREVVDLQLCVDGRESSLEAENVAHKSIGSAESWVDLSSHACRRQVLP